MGRKFTRLILTAALFSLVPWACEPGVAETSPKVLDASVLVLELPKTFGEAERPAVEFKHALHVRAMHERDCKTCHAMDDKQRVLSRLNWSEPATDSQAWRRAYHATCIGCHQEQAEVGQKSGPTDCGDCHIPGSRAVSGRLRMQMDASLHGRHVQAAQDNCETCHHTYDENKQSLLHRRGTESNCWHCHQLQTQGKLISRRDAAHLGCINCHLMARDQGRETGPCSCAGCHGEEQQAKIKRLDRVARLQRGQPDLVWVGQPSSLAKAVPFNHKYHETITSACSDCHHQTLKPCHECHTNRGSPEGAGVSLEQAYHMPDTRTSCVGCHAEQLEKSQCAGCHEVLGQGPGAQSCQICHLAPKGASSQTMSIVNALAELIWLPLPETSLDFPEQISIDVLADQYQASRFPHRRIVTALDRIVRQSVLAKRFHGRAELLCTGCHHHTPIGSRYPSCKACHAGSAHPVKDLPELKVAYHRQCIGCHQRMGHPAQGCEDCHKKAPGEVQP